MKYNNTATSGETWTRAKRIVIENPLNQNNKIKYVEEKVFELNNEATTEPLGVLEVEINADNMNDAIDILDPVTGDPTGTTITYAEIHSIIFSTYIHNAYLRDNPSVEEEPIVDGTTSDEPVA